MLVPMMAARYNYSGPATLTQLVDFVKVNVFSWLHNRQYNQGPPHSPPRADHFPRMFRAVTAGLRLPVDRLLVLYFPTLAWFNLGISAFTWLPTLTGKPTDFFLFF